MIELSFELKINLYISHNGFIYLLFQNHLNSKLEFNNNHIDSICIFYWLDIIEGTQVCSICEYLKEINKLDGIYRLI